MRRTDPECTTRSYFRSQDRLFVMNGQWFYTTREGEVGPFRSRETALKEVQRYVQERRDLDRFQRAREMKTRVNPALTLAIVPKERQELTLEDLILENQR